MNSINHFPLVVVSNPNPVLQFEEQPKPITSTSKRFLVVHGQRVFDLGIVCDTCMFVYRKFPDVPHLPPNELATRLRDGLQTIDKENNETVEQILPSGNYATGLITVYPDYQAPLKKAPRWVGYGEVHPSFYRLGKEQIDEFGFLEQALIPLLSPDSLKQNTLKEYSKKLEDGAKPTAFAISIAEGKRTMAGSGYESPDCSSLMHFWIDGHHKVHAASEAGKAIILLSFLFNYEWAGLTTTYKHNPDMMEVLFDKYYSS